MTTTPDQLMLPGQAAAPAGPCDLNAMYVIHHAFRRDLTRFAAAAAATPTPDAATWTALLERWDHFAHLLHDHHRKEDDVIWPLLLERAAAADDDAARQVLDDMESEHALIDPLLSETRALLVLLARDGDEPDRARLTGVLERAGQVLGDHLGHEERDAVALLQRYVDAAEWARLESKELRGKQTLQEILYFLPWAAEGLDEVVLADLVQQAGLPFRLLLRLGRGRFQRLERRAFAHAG